MITQFGLSAPQLPKDLKSEFSYQTRSLASLFQRRFQGRLKIGNAWKILVEVVPQVERHGCRNLLGVLAKEISGDPAILLDAPDSRKPELALNWLMQGLTAMASELGWDAMEFSKTAEVVKAGAYLNTYTWGSPVLSKGKTKRVEVVIHHGIHQARITGRIFARDGALIREEHFANTRPDELIFGPLLGSLCWEGDENVTLLSKAGKEVATIRAD